MAMKETLTQKPLAEVCGQDVMVPLLGGEKRKYVNLDNAASTPPLCYVDEKVSEFIDWYSSVHRGAGFKSILSTHVMETSRKEIMEFVSADMEGDCLIFVKNTTDAINKLAYRLELNPDDVVITTSMEHHSNDLPWRSKAKTVYVEIKEDGSLDLDDMERKINLYKDNLRLVAVSGASNVTGIMPPIYDIAEMAHAAGVQILVDCAQLAPHRKIVMGKIDSDKRLDFIAFSGHKMYAPYGAGVLIGPKRFFENGAPEYAGGGTIEVVTLEDVHWAMPPERDEAGSPNVVGVVAMAASIKMLRSLGMEVVAQHEISLTAYLLERLSRLPDVHIYGPTDPDALDNKVGVIAFSLNGVPHAKAAAILSFEGGIGVRNGCFCAHPYVLRLLSVPPEQVKAHVSKVLNHDRSQLPGLVRASLGLYNTCQDVDALVEMLERILAGNYFGEYQVVPEFGEYLPRGYDAHVLDEHFIL